MLKIARVLCRAAQYRPVFAPLAFKSALKIFVTQKITLRNTNATLGSKSFPFKPRYIALALSILTWLGFDKEDENKESELITILKRAVLCTQREEYNKAEQMLHLALRVAQQEQNQQGILYCYDLMANLAFDTLQLEKAEKLFVSVLQMLLSNGTPLSDIKVIHISLKLARICQLMAQTERAGMVYDWCLEEIKPQIHKDENAKMLYGVINDWYAQYLLDVGNATKAEVHLNEAYKVCNEIEEVNNEKCMLLLNDLGITSFRAEDYEKAEKFLKEAVSVGKKLDDQSHLGVIHANLGLILLQKGIIKEAEKSCTEGKKIGNKYENTESIEQSNYCLDQIKMNLGK